MAVVLKYISPSGKKVYGDPGTTAIAPAGSNIQVAHSTETLKAGGIKVTTNAKGETVVERPASDVYGKPGFVTTVTTTHPTQEKQIFTPTSLVPMSVDRAVAPALSRYQRAESYLSRKLTGVGNYAISKGITKEMVVKKLVGSPSPESYQGQYFANRSFFKAQEQYTSRIISNIQSKPLTFGITTGIYAGLSYILPGVSAPIIKYVPPVVETGLAIGLTGWYATGIGERVYLAPKGERANVLADITTGEVAPMLIGGYIGTTTIPRGISYLKTLGRKEIPTSQLVIPEILTGKKVFPTAPQSTQLKLFTTETAQRIPGQTKPLLFHATSSKFWKDQISITPGSSELAGLYGSSSVSAHFLGISNKKYTIGSFKLFGTTSNPAVAAIEPAGFRVSPIAFSPTKLFTKQRYVKGKGYAYFTKPAIPGVADIPQNFKTEIESLIRYPYEGTLKKVSGEYFFKYAGTRVPLDIFTPSLIGTMPKVISTKSSFNGVKSISSSYQMPTPLTSPSSYLIANLLSSSKSNIPSKPSLPSLPRQPAYSSRILLSSIEKQPSKPSYPSRGSSSRSSAISSVLGSPISSSKGSASKPSYIPPSRPPTYTSLFKANKRQITPKAVFRLPKQIKFKARYTPSLKANIFKIKGKMPTALSVKSGLVTRPILR